MLAPQESDYEIISNDPTVYDDQNPMGYANTVARLTVRAELHYDACHTCQAPGLLIHAQAGGLHKMVMCTGPQEYRMLNIPAEQLEPIVVENQLGAEPKTNVFMQGLMVRGRLCTNDTVPS